MERKIIVNRTTWFELSLILPCRIVLPVPLKQQKPKHLNKRKWRNNMPAKEETIKNRSSAAMTELLFFVFSETFGKSEQSAPLLFIEGRGCCPTSHFCGIASQYQLALLAILYCFTSFCSFFLANHSNNVTRIIFTLRKNVFYRLSGDAFGFANSPLYHVLNENTFGIDQV